MKSEKVERVITLGLVLLFVILFSYLLFHGFVTVMDHLLEGY